MDEKVDVGGAVAGAVTPMRRHDWPERLADFMDSVRDEPFSWGEHDCCQFAAKAVEAITGENPAARWVYDSSQGAKELLDANGGVEGLVTQALGAPVHPSRMQRGDVVLADLDNGPTAGVCTGNAIAFPASVGVLFLQRSLARLAWRVT